MAWHTSSTVKAEPVGGGSGALGQIWVKYNFDSKVALTFTGVGPSPGAAIADLNSKIQAARPQGAGKSHGYDSSGTVDVTNLKSVFKFTRIDGSVPIPIQEGNQFKISINLSEGTKFMITYYE